MRTCVFIKSIMRIILGTQSKNRRKVFERMGFFFETMSADIDEKAIRHDDPAQMTLLIAQAKNARIREFVEGPAIIITADGVVTYRGRLLEKPGDTEEAAQMLRSYGKGSADVMTSVVVSNTASGTMHEGTNFSKISFDPIPEAVIRDLIEDPVVLTWAGAFSPDDRRLAPYVKEIEGGIEAILGLPKALTERLLIEAMNAGTA